MLIDKQETPSLIIPSKFEDFIQSDDFYKLLKALFKYSRVKNFISIIEIKEIIKEKLIIY